MGKMAMMLDGHFVGDFRWSGKGGLFAGLERAFGASIDAARRYREQSEALATDPHLTPLGRRSKLLEVAAGEPGMALAAARRARRETLEHVAERRAALATAGPDKTDLAGAVLRGEVRQWLRSMKTSERVALLAEPCSLDPITALAIAEGPAQLSGVTAEQRARVLDMAIDAANPGAADELSELEQAADIVANAASHLSRTVGEATGMVASEIDALAHRADPPKLRKSSYPGGEPVMLTADADSPSGWRPARPAELAHGTYEDA